MTAPVDLAGYIWDEASACYRDQRDICLSQAEVLRITDERIEAGFDRLAAMLAAVLVGAVALADWQMSMAIELRRAHIQIAALGRGGFAQMQPEDWAQINEKLTAEYEFLQRFADQIASGELSEDQINARSKLYERGVWATFWRGFFGAAVIAGFTEEQRILHPAEHCIDCVEYASQGWQPLGSLPAPGEGSVCGNNCRCTKEYRVR